MKIAFVTDSTADLPKEYLMRYPIFVVPNLLVIDGKSYEDGEEISREEFYELLPNLDPTPTTAASSIGVYQELYEKLLNQGFQFIISIHASKLLSGIYNAAHTAAKPFGGKVEVLDSEQLSLGLGFQVLAASEASVHGVPLENIIKIIENVRKRVRVYAMLDTLEYVRRSGRVSWAKARLGNLLRIKSFIELKDGKVFSMGGSRTRSKGIYRLKKYLLYLGSLEKLAILHTNAKDDAQEFLEEMDLEPNSYPLIINVNTIIGTHVGPNGLGFAAVIR